MFERVTCYVDPGVAWIVAVASQFLGRLREGKATFRILFEASLTMGGRM